MCGLGLVVYEKVPPPFRIYDMIKNMPKCHSHHTLIIHVYFCCQSHYMNMATSGGDFYLFLCFMPVY